MRSRGLTLIELTVVMLILVAVASIALQSTEGLVQQGRFDATERTLKNVESAVLQYVSDTGVLPVVPSALVNDNAKRMALQSLWSSSGQEPQFQESDLDEEVLVRVGWNGPYLRLPPTSLSAGLSDGWNQPFEFSLGPSNEITSIRSLGADGNDTGTGPYDTLGARSFSDSEIRSAALEGDVTWSNRSLAPATPSDGDGRVAVVLFEPGVSSLVTEQVVVLDSAPYHFAFRTDPPTTPLTTSPTLGVRYLRAYQGNAIPADPSLVDKSILAAAPNKSAIVKVMVRRGATAQDLTLYPVP